MMHREHLEPAGTWDLSKGLFARACAVFLLGAAVAVSQPGQAATNTYQFTYPTRTALTNDGWSFFATVPLGGGTRNTEVATGNVVSYDQTGHPGVLRIPCDAGDLWGAFNNTRNSLFHALSTNWASVRLQVIFTPTADTQQAQLGIYQDDDNYVEVGHVFASAGGGELVALTREDGGIQNSWSPLNMARVSINAVTNWLRLDRDLSTDKITALWSYDGSTWYTVGATSHAMVNPRVCIWTGGSSGGLPACDLRRLDIITSDTPLGPILVAQPQHLVFSTVAGQAYTNVQQLHLIARRAPAAVNYSITSDSLWLSNSVSAGTTPGACDVSVNTTGLAAGVYQGTLTCSAPGAVSALASVTLIVNPAGRAKPATWQGAKAGAMSVWIDDSYPTAYDVLRSNGFVGSYMLWDLAPIPAFATNYVNTGMELGSHTVDHPCAVVDEPALRYELETNLAAIYAASPVPANNLVSFAWPCGVTSIGMKAIAADYFLVSRGFNLNLLEDPTPYDLMELKSFNSHQYSPVIADLKTPVDAAVAQGKWYNLVLHAYVDEDGAIPYAVGKDLWEATAASVTKYILQRDRTVITNYSEAAGQISFSCYRFPLDSSTVRNFEAAVGSQDVMTFQVDVTGIPAVTNVTVNGVQSAYTNRVAAGKTYVLVNMNVTTNSQNVVLRLATASTNSAPVLGTQTNRTMNQLATLVVTNAATDADGPQQTLTYTLVNPPSGATIGTNGVITWTPSQAQSGVFTLTTVVTDSGFPAMSATNSFTVTVNTVNTPPTLPAQLNRTIYMPGGSLLVVTNTASDTDLPANTMTYTLTSFPSGAAIDTNGVITWNPALAQVPSTNVFTTVVTDYNPSAVNSQHLSATNTLIVLVLPPHVPLLGTLSNLTIPGGQTLIVTNKATEAPYLLSPSNTFQFTYPSRNDLLADGWSFTAKLPDGTPRPTEVLPPDVRAISYDQSAHPGQIRIPCDGGDLWANSESSVNTLFRYLPANWLSMTLDLDLAANVDVQQAHLMVYQDDLNYVQVGLAYNTGLNPASGTIFTAVWDVNGYMDHIVTQYTTVTNLHMRMTRSDVDSSVTCFYSFDGTTWVTIGTVPNLGFVNTRLGIWCGGSTVAYTPGGTTLNLRRLDLTVPSSVPTVLTYSLLNAPRGATIDTNGVIRWTPSDPGTYVITTLVSDNGGQTATNSFTVTVPTAAPPVLPSLSTVSVNEGQIFTVTNTATTLRNVYPWSTNTLNFTYADRFSFTNDGWSFLGTRANGTTRPTEAAAGVTYASNRLSIICQAGDLWTTYNNTTNSIFRAAPTNWLSARLNFTFAPTVNYHQAHLGIYQNDDNYAQVGMVVNAGSGGLGATTDSETNGYFLSTFSPLAANGNITVRLDRNPANNGITGLYSRDGSNWVSIATYYPTLVNPRFAIWAGGGTAGPPNPAFDVYRLDVVVSNNAPVALNYALINSPTNASISTNGIITWTPTEGQGPSTNVITTVVTDTGTPSTSATNSFILIVNEVNLPPTLPAQNSRTLAGRQTLIVTNTAIDADIPANGLTYSFLTAPSGAAIDTNGIITWTPLASQAPSTNVITTVVTDYNPWAVNSQHLSATNSFTVVVNTTHTGPALPIQTNLAVNEFTSLILTNTAIDNDAPVLSLNYSLVAPPPGLSINTNGILTWTPIEAQGPSTNIITTIVTDTGTPALSATNVFTLVVNEINLPPVLPGQANKSLAAMQPLLVANTAIDPDIPTNSLTYQLTSAPSGAAIDTNGIITWTPTLAQVPSTNVITTVVTDDNPWAISNQHLTATNSFVVIVYPIRNGPTLPYQPSAALPELTTLTITNTASDFDIPLPSTLTYTLTNSPEGVSIDTNGIITWTPTEVQGPSTNTITTIVMDNGSPVLSASNSFSVVVQEVNLPPVLPLQTNYTLAGLQPLVVTNTGTDPDIPANSLTYSLLAAPSGATVDTSGIITWTPVVSQVPSTNVFTTVVTDFNPWAINAQHLTATNSFTVMVNATHNGPALPVQADRTIAPWTTLMVTNTAIDNDVPPLTLYYSLFISPQGAAIDSDGIITWTPTELQAPSTNLFRCLVYDSGTPWISDIKEFTVFVNEINVPPALPTQTNRTLVGQQSLIVTNTATITNFHIISVSYQLAAAPAGTAIDTNGVITWTPSVAQVPSTNVFTTVATDFNPSAANEQHLSSTNSFTVVVNAIHNAPVLPVLTNATVAQYASLTVTNTASTTNLPALALAYSLVNPPSGAVISTNGIITWTPGAGQGHATNTITTVVTDTGTPALSATNSFSVVVNEINLAPVLPTQTDRALYGLQALNLTNTATQADMPPVTLSYQLSGPAGASIDTNGIISWTPSVAQVPSTNLFTTIVSNFNPWAVNAQSLKATNTFTVVVNAIHNGPALPTQPSLTIAQYTALSVTNTATDNDVPPLALTYSLTAAPAGATISTNGLISWTPGLGQGHSTNTFTSVIRDAGTPSLSATNSFTVVVNEINLAPVLPGQTDRSLAGRQSLSVTNTASQADMPPVSLAYQLNGPSGASIDANGLIAWTPSVAQVPSTNLFTTIVSNFNSWAVNTQSLSATNSFTVVVNATHNGPALPGQSDLTIAQYSALRVTNTASDSDLPALALTYSLTTAPAGALIDTNGLITWTPGAGQGHTTNTFTTVVMDAGSPALSWTNSFHVVVNEINLAPVLPTQTNRTLVAIQALTVANTATQADMPPVTLSYQLIGPSGSAIDANGIISWTPTVAQVPSTNVFTTIVSNFNNWAVNTQSLKATNTFTVVVNAIHNGPLLPAQTDLTIAQYSALLVTNTASDTDVPPLPLSYSLAAAPAGALIDTNGVISWTPGPGQGHSTNTFTTVVIDAGTPALSSTNTFSVAVNEINVAPVLPVQTNLSLAGRQPLTVVNTATEPDMPPVTLTYQLSGPIGSSIDANGVITWTPSLSQVPSTNVFTTVVTDFNPWAVNSQYLSATNSFTVVVNFVHNGPTLLVQSDRTVNEMAPLMVVNTANDNDIPVRKLTYSLLSPPEGAAINKSGVITWTPSEAQGPGVYTITTVVADDGTPSLSATNSFLVTVNEINVPPMLSVQTNRVLSGLQLLSVTNVASDSDLPANPLAYALDSAPAGAIIDTNGVITWTPVVSQVPSTNLFTMVVTDYSAWAVNELQLSATNSFTVVVNVIRNGPSLPELTNCAVNELVTLTVTNTASDADVPPYALTYTLVNPPVGAVVDTNGVITWTPSQEQSHTTNTITTVVSDAGVPSLSATNSFTVVVNEINIPPSLPTQPDRLLIFGLQTLTVNNAATEPNIHSVTLGYELLEAPVGAAIDGNGVITWTPEVAQVPSTNTFTTVVTNSNTWAINSQSLSATNSFTVVVIAQVHNGPVLPTQADVTVEQYSTLMVTNTGTDSDIPSVGLTYSLADPPSGAVISTNGIITWTPGAGQGHSTNTITTVVTDTGTPALSATNSFSVVVNEINLAPVLPTQTDRALYGLQALNLTNTATQADMPPVTLSYQLSGPAGASIDTNGIISWTPSVAQVPSTNLFTTIVSNFNPWAVNAQSLKATNTFTVVVNAIHNGPALPTQPSLTIAQYTALSVTNTATDNDVPPLALTYSLTAAPAGATISTNGLISWTPGLGQGHSTNTFTSVIRDAGTPSLSATNSFTVVVNEINLAPVLPGQTDRSLAGRQSLSVTNTASQADMPPVSLAYQLNGPSGASIDANGLIAWTPSVAQVPSTNLFTTIVSNFNSWAVNTQSLSATNSFTVVVNATHNGPALPGQSDLTIAQYSALRVTNTASDSDLPALALTYSLTTAPAGALIDTNGLITWTPGAGQGHTTNTFTTVVMDAGSPALSWTNSFHVVVNEINLAPVLPTQTNRTLVAIQALTVANTATQADMPPVTLSYQLIGPSGSAIDANGIISWTPTVAQVPSTNLFTTIVSNFNNWAVNTQSLKATNTFTVVVNAIHNGPLLPAQTDLTIAQYSALLVTNTASDTDVPPLPLSYSLAAAPAGALIDTNGVISWTPGPGQGHSTNTFTTVVIDAGTPALSSTNTFSVAVNEINVAPVLPVQATRGLVGTQPLVVTNTAAEPDMPPVTLSYQLTGPAGASISTNGIITWTPTPAQVPSTNVFTTVVTDFNPWAVNAQQLSATNTFTVLVAASHNGPSLPSQTNLTIAQYTTLTMTNTATDADVPALGLAYSLLGAPLGMTINTNGIITWTPVAGQGHSTNLITTVVTDTGTPPLSATNSFTVVVNEINTPPMLSAQIDRTLAGMQHLVVTNTAVDSDIPANQLSYSFLTAPAGATIDTNGIINWTPSLAQVPGGYLFKTVVTDYSPWAVNQQHLSATNSFTVVVNPVHNGPTLPLQPDVTMAVWTTLRVTNTAIDTDVPLPLPLTYFLNTAPANASIDTNGIITWTPTEAQAPSTNQFVTLVYDNDQNPIPAVNSFTVYVNEINVPPALPVQTNRVLVGLQSLTVTNTAIVTNFHIVSVAYQLAASPAGAAIDTNGIISWTPMMSQVPSTNIFTTIATDYNPSAANEQHLSTTNSFVVTVNAIHNGPSLPVQTNLTIAQYSTLSVTNAASDSDVPTLALSYALDNAPAGAAISTNGIISWTPGVGQGHSTNMFRTIVTDSGTPVLSATNTFTVVVNEINVAPVLSAQPDRFLYGLQALNVTNTATQKDMPPVTLSYLLSGPAGATIDTNGVIAWTPSMAQLPSTNVFTTIVTNLNPWAINAQSLSATNAFTVIASIIHNGPMLPVQTNLTIDQYTLLTITNTATDTDQPLPGLLYSLISAPLGATVNTNGIITWTPGSGQGHTTNTITTVVTDTGVPPLSVTNSFNVVVNEVNTAPILAAQPNRALFGQQTLSVTNTAAQLDMPPVTLSYILTGPSGATIDANGIITWTPTLAQLPSTNVFTTVVTNFNPWSVNAQSLSATNTFTAVANVIHNGPNLPTQTNVTIAQYTTLNITNTANDSDVPALALSYNLAAAPVGAAISTNGIITWTPAAGQGHTTNTFTTIVSDAGIPALSATNSFAVVVNEINIAPSLSNMTNRILVGLQALTVTNTATQVDMPPVTLAYQLAGPSGASIDSNGVISWTPTIAQVPSTNVFTTIVSNSNPWAVNAQHLSATNNFTVLVNAIHNGPALPVQTTKIVNELTTLIVTNTAIDNDVPPLPLNYSLLAYPSGASFNPTNGVITWTPTEAQGSNSYNFTTIVYDSGTPQKSDMKSFTVVVNEINLPPVLPSQTNRTLVGQQTLTVTNTASDPDIPVNSLAYTFLAAPAGAVIDSNGIITWTPAPAQVPSTNTFTTLVTDSNFLAVNAQHLNATNSFVVVVNPLRNGPSLPARQDVTVTALTTLTVTNTATDSDIPAPTLTYSLINPPSGATINSSGVISWTPSALQAPSTNTITTVVTDNGTPALSATNAFKVIVNASTQLVITSIRISGTNALVTFNSVAGHTYKLQYRDSLTSGNWVDVTPNVTATGPTTIATNALGSSPQRFFRVQDVVLAPRNGPALPSQQDVTLTALMTLTVTNTATDTDVPSPTLTYSLVNPPSGATISSSGVISWTPTTAQAPSTNLLTTVVTDNGTPALSATNTFKVAVNAIAQFGVSSIRVSGTNILVTYNSVAGHTYRLQYRDSLTSGSWQDVVPDITAIGPSTISTNSLGGAAQRFYRIQYVR